MVNSACTGSPRPILEGVYRKACDFCVRSKRRCRGGVICEQCIKRDVECTRSERRKSGPRTRRLSSSLTVKVTSSGRRGRRRDKSRSRDLSPAASTASTTSDTCHSPVTSCTSYSASDESDVDIPASPSATQIGPTPMELAVHPTSPSSVRAPSLYTTIADQCLSPAAPRGEPKVSTIVKVDELREMMNFDQVPMERTTRDIIETVSPLVARSTAVKRTAVPETGTHDFSSQTGEVSTTDSTMQTIDAPPPPSARWWSVPSWPVNCAQPSSSAMDTQSSRVPTSPMSFYPNAAHVQPGPPMSAPFDIASVDEAIGQALKEFEDDDSVPSDMIPSLTRDTSLARAVEALGSEDATQYVDDMTGYVWRT